MRTCLAPSRPARRRGATRGVTPSLIGNAMHVATVLTLALAACAEPPSAAPALGPAGAGVSSATHPSRVIVGDQVYSWSQGQLATHLGSNGLPWARRVCFLTRVSGNFSSAGEWVRVWLSGSDWYLGGASSTSGVGAQARCMIVLTYSAEYFAHSASTNVRVLNEGSRWGCFVTGVGGDLAGYVRTIYYVGSWRLIAHAGSSSAGLWGRVRCARPLDGDANAVEGEEYIWNDGDPPLFLEPDTRACVITLVGGPFDTPNGYMSIVNVFGTWVLSSNQPSESHQGATCFS